MVMGALVDPLVMALPRKDTFVQDVLSALKLGAPTMPCK